MFAALAGIQRDPARQWAAWHREYQLDRHFAVANADLTDHAQFDQVCPQLRIQNRTQGIADQFLSNGCHALLSFSWKAGLSPDCWPECFY